MENTEQWIEHPQHPLMLVGFALFIVASVVYLLKPAILSSATIERLFGSGLSYVFIFSLFVIAPGTYISLFDKTDNPERNEKFPALTPKITTISLQVTKQSTMGDKSPAIHSQRDVNINDGQ